MLIAIFCLLQGLQKIQVNLPLLISSGSLIISIGTFYWNFLRPAKFVGPPIRWIAFYNPPIEQARFTVINFPISVVNVGGKLGIIDSFCFDLIQESLNEKRERFYALREGKILNKEDFRDFDIPSPVSLKPAEALVKYYIFIPHSPEYKITKGDYQLLFYGYVEGKEQKLFEQRLKILETFELSLIQGVASYLFSFTLFPKEVLEVKSHGNKIDFSQIDWQ